MMISRTQLQETHQAVVGMEGAFFIAISAFVLAGLPTTSTCRKLLVRQVAPII